MVSVHPLKTKIVNICKDLVIKQGWNDQVLNLAFEQQGLSVAAGRGMFPNGIIEVAEDLMKEWEGRIAVEVKLQDIEGKSMEDQVFYVLKKRLMYEIEYMPKWNEAMMLGLQPQNLGSVYDRLYYTMNTVCDILGDKSSGIDWYTKRMIIGKIFVCTEANMTLDTSENFENTWKFLNKQVKGLTNETFTSCSELSLWTFKYTLRNLNLIS